MMNKKKLHKIELWLGVLIIAILGVFLIQKFAIFEGYIQNAAIIEANYTMPTDYQDAHAILKINHQGVALQVYIWDNQAGMWDNVVILHTNWQFLYEPGTTVGSPPDNYVTITDYAQTPMNDPADVVNIGCLGHWCPAFKLQILPEHVDANNLVRYRIDFLEVDGRVAGYYYIDIIHHTTLADDSILVESVERDDPIILNECDSDLDCGLDLWCDNGMINEKHYCNDGVCEGWNIPCPTPLQDDQCNNDGDCMNDIICPDNVSVSQDYFCKSNGGVGGNNVCVYSEWNCPLPDNSECNVASDCGPTTYCPASTIIESEPICALNNMNKTVCQWKYNECSEPFSITNILLIILGLIIISLVGYIVYKNKIKR